MNRAEGHHNSLNITVDFGSHIRRCCLSRTGFNALSWRCSLTAFSWQQVDPQLEKGNLPTKLWYNMNTSSLFSYIFPQPELCDMLNCKTGHAVSVSRKLPHCIVSTSFYQRDAVLARYYLRSCVCLSVCLSVRHKSEFYQNGWTDRAVAQRLPSTYSTLCWKVTEVSPKLRILISGTLSQTLTLKQFRNCTSTGASVVNLGGHFLW